MTPTVALMLVASSTFKPTGTIPARSAYAADCGGQNRSPELHWSGAPAGTRSYAIVMHDPDAPVPGGFDHWLAYNIPAETHRLAEGQKLRTGQLGVNGFGEQGYGGPCPPPGKPHRYVITVYALDVASIGGPNMKPAQLQAAMRGHVLKTAAVTGLYGR